ncbi:hypothetical protein CGZ91_01330 [Parenemella sanctibonifatiensis]|uniref:Uncharacterized protein n=1 Tax=Parenemella sanctibonifatiensis TaxID=2016505 RepID=A0A255EMH2_9ACTN|nr:hypothetical protein CGZ91_01330 [Parenemella sanctibonifatiensis]
MHSHGFKPLIFRIFGPRRLLPYYHKKDCPPSAAHLVEAKVTVSLLAGDEAAGQPEVQSIVDFTPEST